MERHEVFRSDRIRVTEEMLREQEMQFVLEVGGGDYSFDYVKSREPVSWTKADFQPPCDVVCDFNDQKLTLPFADDSFDMIICTEVIEHLLWPQQLLNEARRMLAPHGMILLSIPNVCSLSYRIAWLLGHIPSCAASGNIPPDMGSTTYRQESGDLVGGHVVDFNLPRLRSLLDKTGFRAVAVRGSGIIWHGQLLPHWVVPVSLSSNIICLAKKKPGIEHMTEDTGPQSQATFYESINRETVYAVASDCREHPFYPMLTTFIERRRLKDKKCLEIGSSKGLFQDMADDYTGVDIAETLRKYYRKPYFVVSDTHLPFPDNHFDAVFTYATHEHIPDVEKALEEIARVLKPGGFCLFAPAWHSRPWFAGGYQVRPYADLSLAGKLVKLSIPIRDFALVRWPLVLLRRITRLCSYLLSSGRPVPLRYRKLKANYEKFWQSDSDACNSLDPFDAILWFRSRGFVCHGYESPLRTILTRALGLELQKPLPTPVRQGKR